MAALPSVCDWCSRTMTEYAPQHYLAAPSDTPSAAVLVIPTWMGLNDFAKAHCDALAELGYVGFGIDLFGGGTVATTPDEARELIRPLVLDRKRLRERLLEVIEEVKGRPEVDTTKIGVIGFCFGGMCALELAKSGVKLSGIVTFHASLGNPGGLPSEPVESAASIPTPLLMLHGYKDALAPEEELLKLERELARRGADWQVVTYGEAMHAFTNPKANMPERSLQYNEKIAGRAWHAMVDFFAELF